MSTPQKAPAADPLAYLDAHIVSQAAHYGLTPERKAYLFDGAAEYAELIELGVVEEPGSR